MERRRRWYSDQLSLQHYISEERLSKTYFPRLKEASEQSYLRVFAYEAVLKMAGKNTLLTWIFYFPAYALIDLITGESKFRSLAEACNPLPFNLFKPEVTLVKQMFRRLKSSPAPHPAPTKHSRQLPQIS